MKTLQIQTETANHLILNYKGELITIDSDCNELYIGTKMYKIAALRRHIKAPKSEIKLLAAPKVHQAIIIPQIESVYNVWGKTPRPEKTPEYLRTLNKKPITIVFHNGKEVFRGSEIKVRTYMKAWYKWYNSKDAEFYVDNIDCIHEDSGMAKGSNPLKYPIAAKNSFTFETQY